MQLTQQLVKALSSEFSGLLICILEAKVLKIASNVNAFEVSLSHAHTYNRD